MSVQIRYSKAARSALFRSDKRKLIREKIERFAGDPNLEHPNVTRLKGQPEWRLRVQNWRVIFRIEGDQMVVVEIGPRGAIYED